MIFEKLWIATNPLGQTFVYTEKPYRGRDHWLGTLIAMLHQDDVDVLLPTWEDEPQQVIITLFGQVLLEKVEPQN